MEKKKYIFPLIEVEQIKLTGMLMESPVVPPKPHPGGAPLRRPEDELL